jgi:predicted ATP-grasp superfamily ATP-dependent carboligase
MRVFAYEALSAGAISDPSPAGSLRAEGWAMLSALLEDLVRIPQVETVTSLQARSVGEGIAGFPRLRFGLVKCEITEAGFAEELHLFRKLAAQADFTLVIAPETEGLLYQRCRLVEECGGKLLGPSSEAIRLTSDKLVLAGFLRNRGIPTPPCVVAEFDGQVTYPAVMKPRDGAGSQATVLVRKSADIERSLAMARAEGWTGELILQPFIPGQACSVSFLIGDAHVEALLPVSQILSDDGRFRYQGGCIPLAAPLAARATRLAACAVQALPGLHGYVGVDLVLGSAEDGSEDYVIEINPRLTTSYVGLRALVKSNLAEAMIQAACGQAFGPLEWDVGSVRFWPEGRIDRPIGERGAKAPRETH